MEISQVANILNILLLVSSALCLQLPSPEQRQLDSAGLRVSSTLLGVTQEPTGDSFVASSRSKRGYLPTVIAYPPALPLATVAGLPIVTSYAYYGHFGKPAIVPPIPQAYSALTYVG